MARLLKGYTHRCIISFLDFYAKIRISLKNIGARELKKTEIQQLAQRFAQIADEQQLTVYTCCESEDLTPYGIFPAACIDEKMIEQILGCSVSSPKGTKQRLNCGCVESVDIGSYDSCINGCKYCYANSGIGFVQNNIASHDMNAPVLYGKPAENAMIVEKKMISVRDEQLRLF